MPILLYELYYRYKYMAAIHEVPYLPKPDKHKGSIFIHKA